MAIVSALAFATTNKERPHEHVMIAFITGRVLCALGSYRQHLGPEHMPRHPGQCTVLGADEGKRAPIEHVPCVPVNLGDYRTEAVS